MIGGLITPRPGPGVCPACFNFTREPSGRCRACRASEAHLGAVVPISYALANGSLHRALADYKRAAEPAVPDLLDGLAALLAGFLSGHEACVAEAAGAGHFDRVVVVPSSDPRRDAHHPLRRIVGRRVADTAGRYHASLRASGARCVPHRYDPHRFRAVESLTGARVLLIDDVWTTGACAQSAAACLRAAGAEHVAAVVIGRYVNGSWGNIAERLERVSEPFTADACAICRPGSPSQLPLKSDGDPFHGPPSDGLLTGPRNRPG